MIEYDHSSKQKTVISDFSTFVKKNRPHDYMIAEGGGGSESGVFIPDSVKALKGYQPLDGDRSKAINTGAYTHEDQALLALINGVVKGVKNPQWFHPLMEGQDPVYKTHISVIRDLLSGTVRGVSATVAYLDPLETAAVSLASKGPKTRRDLKKHGDDVEALKGHAEKLFSFAAAKTGTAKIPDDLMRYKEKNS